jgi:HAMP domain-containing protein
VQLERTAPTLTYRVVFALAGVALGLGALMITWSSGRQAVTGVGSTLWFVAVSTLIFSSLMAMVITLSFMRRLRVLSDAAFRLAQGKADAPLEPPRDPITSLALSVTKLSERGTELLRELEQCVEEEQARVDELVRERTRALARESDDYRRMLGDTKGLLTIDREGRVVAQSVALESWLGTPPRAGQFWEYFDRASEGVGARFESAWARAVAGSGELDLAGMPPSLTVGHRHFVLEYRGVLDGDGKLDRVLVLLSDVTIPEPDPATSSRHTA